jgi:predicted metal-dependent HD superfamily phosphohydrolase
MSVRVEVENVDGILSDWKGVIGADYEGYRNHVVRMLAFCSMLRSCGAEEREKLEIAACFHDIGLWTANTFDYLRPSVAPAKEYLKARGRSDWADEIETMILEHHKLRPVAAARSPLVELFRKGDLVDLSLGVVRFGLPKDRVRQVRAESPNAGFHRGLLRPAVAWFIRHPFNPAPMMKW